MKNINTKWDKGRVLILGGSRGTTFTIKNSAEAALRAGCGLVVACVKNEIVPILESNSGTFKILGFQGYDTSSANKVIDLLDRSNTMVCGMGIEDSPKEIKDFFKKIINETKKTIILDADAVVLIGEFFEDILQNRKNKNIPLILLMNIAETKKFFKTENPNKDFIKDLSEKYNIWFVLKGIKTQIISPKKEMVILKTDEIPEMANAGAGDVLAGILGGFVAKGMPIMEAIQTAIRVRIEAAKYYLKTVSDITTLPQDLIKSIPFVWNNINKDEK